MYRYTQTNMPTSNNTTILPPHRPCAPRPAMLDLDEDMHDVDGIICSTESNDDDDCIVDEVRTYAAAAASRSHDAAIGSVKFFGSAAVQKDFSLSGLDGNTSPQDGTFYYDRNGKLRPVPQPEKKQNGLHLQQQPPQQQYSPIIPRSRPTQPPTPPQDLSIEEVLKLPPDQQHAHLISKFGPVKIIDDGSSAPFSNVSPAHPPKKPYTGGNSTPKPSSSSPLAPPTRRPRTPPNQLLPIIPPTPRAPKYIPRQRPAHHDYIPTIRPRASTTKATTSSANVPKALSTLTRPASVNKRSSNTQKPNNTRPSTTANNNRHHHHHQARLARPFHLSPSQHTQLAKYLSTHNNAVPWTAEGKKMFGDCVMMVGEDGGLVVRKAPRSQLSSGGNGGGGGGGVAADALAGHGATVGAGDVQQYDNMRGGGDAQMQWQQQQQQKGAMPQGGGFAPMQLDFQQQRVTQMQYMSQQQYIPQQDVSQGQQQYTPQMQQVLQQQAQYRPQQYQQGIQGRYIPQQQQFVGQQQHIPNQQVLTPAPSFTSLPTPPSHPQPLITSINNFNDDDHLPLAMEWDTNLGMGMDMGMVDDVAHFDPIFDFNSFTSFESGNNNASLASDIVHDDDNNKNNNNNNNHDRGGIKNALLPTPPSSQEALAAAGTDADGLAVVVQAVESLQQAFPLPTTSPQETTMSGETQLSTSQTSVQNAGEGSSINHSTGGEVVPSIEQERGEVGVNMSSQGRGGHRAGGEDGAAWVDFSDFVVQGAELSELPELPEMPEFPMLPEMSAFPNFPAAPGPELAAMPVLPALPELPELALPQSSEGEGQQQQQQQQLPALPELGMDDEEWLGWMALMDAPVVAASPVGDAGASAEAGVMAELGPSEGEGEGVFGGEVSGKEGGGRCRRWRARRR